MKARLDVLPHQDAFANDNTTRHLLLLGGFGSGKTAAAAIKAYTLAGLNQGFDGCLLSPTFGMAADIFQPAFEELLDTVKRPWKYQGSPLPRYTLKFKHTTSTVFVRNFEKYRRLVGLNLAWAVCDEIDTVDSKIASVAYKKLQARIRCGRVRQIASVTTPEGFGFAYNFWEKEGKNPDGTKKTDRRIIRAKTLDNPFVPWDYIYDLRANYPPNLIDAYLNGLFVNLATGRVYPCYDRYESASTVTVEPDDHLRIGMDFNKGKMAAVVHLILQPGDERWLGEVLISKTGKTEQVHAVDEFCDLSDTPHMIREIGKRYPEHLRRKLITVYPDASGNHGSSTNATESDLSLLRQGGIMVDGPASNPLVRDRVAAMNAMFFNQLGHRRYFVNHVLCPTYADCLEQQPYGDDGKPDKKLGLDHSVDSAGYLISYRYPVLERRAQPTGFRLFT